MRLKRIASSLLITGCVVLGLSGVGAIQGASATSHPSYPLGHARSCKAHYVKKTERHKVKGHEVRYVACTYVAPVVATTTTSTTTTSTTTTTLAPGPTATVVVNMLDGRLFTDRLTFYFDSLPPPPNVDALPGETVDLEAFVNEPTTAGSVTFYVNGQVVPSCTSVAVSFNATPTQSEAICEYQFNSGGTVTLQATFLGSDRSQGSAQRTFTVASPDEDAIVLQECALAASMFAHCLS